MPASDLRLKGSLCLRIDYGEQTTGWVVEGNLEGEEMFGQTEGARARVHNIYIVQAGVQAPEKAGVQAPEKDLPTIHMHTKH